MKICDKFTQLVGKEAALKYPNAETPYFMLTLGTTGNLVTIYEVGDDYVSIGNSEYQTVIPFNLIILNITPKSGI